MLKKIKNNKAFKIITKILQILLYIVIGLYLLLIVFQKVSNNSSLFGIRVFTVASNSMSPVYEIGDVIVIKEIKQDDIKIGDDITYLGKSSDLAGKVITHRLIEITETENGKKYILQGVANTASDPAISYNQIYGKVIYKTVLISFINTIVRNQFGFFFIIFVPLVIIVFLEVVDTVKDIKNKNNEE